MTEEEQMPEGTEETTATTIEPAPAEPAPVEQAPAEPQGAEPGVEPTPPPGVNDAINIMNQRLEDLAARIPEAEQGDPIGALTGEFEYDEPGNYGVEPQQQQQQGQPDPLDAVREWIQEEGQGIRQELEMDRRVEGIQAFAKAEPKLLNPEVLPVVERFLSVMDPNFGQPRYAPHPEALRAAYLAAQAELAQQGGEQPEQAPAEPGQHVETGAGPGAQPAQMDPVEQAYANALGGGANTDPWGFPTE